MAKQTNPAVEVQPDLFIERILSMEIARVTERAAVSAARLRGRGDEKAADQAAVDAMRPAMVAAVPGLSTAARRM